ncbi:MAG: vitamin K epoxide reductase family protein [Thermoplasmata archaeon]
MKPQTLHGIILTAAILGLALAIFATLETIDPALQSACSVDPIFSCGAVTSSGHTTIFGIPDWSIGLAGFVLLVGLDVPLYRTWKRPYLAGVLALSAIGLGLSLYLAYVEVFVIGHVCPVCLGTYIANGFVLAAALGLWLKGKDPHEETTAATSASSAAAGADV